VGKIFVVIAFVTLWASNGGATENQQETWEIAVGVQRSIRLAHAVETVNVSRKGIVDLSEISPTEFVITGLRRGFVVVSFAQGEAMTKLFVLVAEPNAVRAKTRVAKNASKQQERVFRVKLALVGQDKMQTRAIDLSLRERSFPLGTDLFREWPQNSASEATGSALAEANFLAVSGMEAKVRSGIELRIDEARNRELTVAWKPVGLEAGLTIEPGKNAESVRLKYAVGLSTRHGEAIRVSQLAGATHVALNEESAIGDVVLTGATNHSDQDWLLARIPIVAPIFRKIFRGEQEGTLRVVVRVEAVEK
jgi:hypothetical protein